MNALVAVAALALAAACTSPSTRTQHSTGSSLPGTVTSRPVTPKPALTSLSREPSKAAKGTIRKHDLCASAYQAPVEKVFTQFSGPELTAVSCRYQEFQDQGKTAYQGQWQAAGSLGVVLVVVPYKDLGVPTLSGADNWDAHGCPARWVSPILVVHCGDYDMQIRVIAPTDSAAAPIAALSKMAVARIWG